MQEALRILSDYWTARGCLTVQPFNSEVGAGTMNPATVLRVLGPEPWDVAYAEPSVRPDDSRYGENPNRLQTHTQFQVILKPEPGNPQELYLGSLEALGIDLSAHDVRFVEDNWQQPAIGAWGLGWEVWLDGMEITQFTYFQQVGGQNLDPIPVELTYGMERILMAVQDVTHFKDISYAPGITYGEAFGQTEYEMSRYYLDEADVTANRDLYDTYVAEATRLIEARLPVPAHSYVLKSSHAFNVLDARGAISTTQRAKAFATMRNLARQVAELWVARRDELGFPLLKADPTAPRSSAAELTLDLLSGSARVDSNSTIVQTRGESEDSPQQFTLEIGVEELPPHQVQPAIDQVHAAVSEVLQASRLAHGEVRVDATPRRIVAVVDAVAAGEADYTQLRKGPKWGAAFDDSGAPTRALEGFARGAGVDVAEVIKAEIGGQEHAAVEMAVTGRSAHDVLAGAVRTAITSLRADKNMRWRDQELSYSRAIRWIMALRGSELIEVQVSGLISGRTTYVHRTADKPFIALDRAEDLLQSLGAHEIVLSQAQRRQSVIDQATELANLAGGTLDTNSLHGLIDEITNLVETPHGILGGFDERYLELPEEILTAVMAKHQRYLPVRNAEGFLLPHFITMANGACDDEVVRAGNERVLRARYEDALFFWNADLRAEDLSDFVPVLENLSFADGLGSMGARARRVSDVAQSLAPAVGLDDTESRLLEQAGALVKFDLGTQMVTEMSSLAGFVAREYALRKGVDSQVAVALEEAEQPRTAAGRLPESTIGGLLAVADRADLLVGLLATGVKATGSSDPFGLRRAALGLMRILAAPQHARFSHLSLNTVLESAADRLRSDGVMVAPEIVQAGAEFARSRFEQLLREEGSSADLVQALAGLGDRPQELIRHVEQIGSIEPYSAAANEFAAFLAAWVRITRILPESVSSDPAAASFDSDLLVEEAEAALVAQLQHTDDYSPFNNDLLEFAAANQALFTAIQRFFDDILVMADDPAVRSSRLGLLANVLLLVPLPIDWARLDQATPAAGMVSA